MVIVTASYGRPTTGVTDDSMLSPETLAKTLLLNYTGMENDSMTSEERVRGRRRRLIVFRREPLSNNGC
jgi:hypothetical protein